MAPSVLGRASRAPWPLDHELTGTLVLEEPGEASKHAVCFTQGRPSKARTAHPMAQLGRVSAELDEIPEPELTRTFAEAEASGELHGQVLKRAGIIDEPMLRAGLREQLARQPVFLVPLPGDTLFGYYDQVDPRTLGRRRVQSRPLNMIWRVIQTQAEPARVAAVLDRIQGQPLQLHSSAPVQRFRFSSAEQVIVDLWRAKPQPLEELLARAMADRTRVERLVYALVITRQLDLGFDVAPFGVDEPPPSIRPAVPPRRSSSGAEVPILPPRVSGSSSTALLASDSGARISSSSSVAPGLPPKLLAFREELARPAGAERHGHFRRKAVLYGGAC